MKKTLAIFLTLACLITLVACNSNDNGGSISNDDGRDILNPYFTGEVIEVYEKGCLLEVTDIGNGNFGIGDKVQVTGTSKGKGFAGTVKRYNFQESRNTHGFKGDIRKVGSIGSMYPQKVFKGKKMPGRMGHDRVTVKNLVVSYIDSDHNLIGLKGAVPGPNKGLVMVEGKD